MEPMQSLHDVGMFLGESAYREENAAYILSTCHWETESSMT